MFTASLAGCQKNENVAPPSDNTYIILANNTAGSSSTGELTIQTSLMPATTFKIPGASTHKEIRIKAAPSEFVKFTIHKNFVSVIQVTDAKNKIIADYNKYGSQVSTHAQSQDYGFIAFDVNDPDKDFLKFNPDSALAH